MPRPKHSRCIETLPQGCYFKPRGVPMSALEDVTLTLDEMEALRLADWEGLYHEEAGRRMRVSRPTFGRILADARRKVADALLHAKALRIEGGPVITRDRRWFECRKCRHHWDEPFGTGRPERCPSCGRPRADVKRIQ